MQTPLNVGVDVASREVVVACAVGSFAPHSVSNDSRALKRWLQCLPPGSRVGLESTGRYHGLLADLASAAGHTVFVLNPYQVRRYAQALGRRGKTDRLDAQVIATYLAEHHSRLHAYVPATPTQRNLEQLLKRRAKLIATRGAVQQSLGDLPALAHELQQLQADFKAALAKIDALLQRALQELPQAAEHAQHLATVRGFGPLASTSLASILSRIPFANGDAFVAYTGLDPEPDDSGQRRGRRRLSKHGPRELRRLLYACAMSATRTKSWAPYYQAQRAKGLSSTAAIVVLARKMARVAFAICKHNTSFDPARLTAPA